MYRFILVTFITGLFVTTAFPSSLQDWEFNVNGTDYYPSGGATLGSVPGLDSSGFNASSGLGTLTFTFNPGMSGSYYIGGWFFIPVSVPFYNEYGAVNNVGSLDSGQSYQVDIPEYDVVSANQGGGTILDNLASGSLNDTNSVTGTTDNYLNNCGANGGGSADTSCNDFVSMALGFNFTLGANQEEVITLELMSGAPGGFSVEAIHPVDGSNATESDVFLSGGAVTETIGQSPIPEPASWSLAGMAFAFLAFCVRRRLLKN
jgi:PEP-CTERM motif